VSQIVDLTRLILREVVSQPSCLWEVPLDTSSQISHMFWGMLGFWCKSRWHDALDWDWGGESLFRRVVCVDCPLSSDKKIAKLKIIWILLMAREGVPYTAGARASNLNTPYCDDVACSQVLWLGCFPQVFFIQQREEYMSRVLIGLVLSPRGLVLGLVFCPYILIQHTSHIWLIWISGIPYNIWGFYFLQI
jgi:hypothetical protein